MNLERMNEQDLDEIYALEVQCFKEPWQKKDFLYELNENPFSQGWVYRKDGNIVGYAFLWVTFEIAQIANIGVRSSVRNQGIGYQMMEKLCEIALAEECEFMTLEARASNASALALYKKCGFIQVNVSKGYYPDGEDAIVLTKAL